MKNEGKRLHDLERAARMLGDLVDLVKDGCDFSTSEGKELITEAEEAKTLLQSELAAMQQELRERKA